ncbi:MAG: 30S ribosomal protein S20 [Candidatus Eisenbacteria bacterium]|nr:30S ribosomal protein S20 [Candidatus Eisenbacteria bacterium]
MPHHKSAEKRVKTNERDRQRNVANRSRLRKAVGSHRALTDPTEAQTGLSATVSEIDRAVRIGLIPKSRANRVKSRTAKAVNKLG